MTESIGARLYTRGATESRTVALAWRGSALEIAPENGTPWLVQAGALAFEARGFNHSQLAIRWTEAGDARLLMLDEGAAATLTDSVPGVLRERVDRVRGTRKRTERRFRLGLAAVLLFVVLPIAAIIAFILKGEALVDWVVERVPASIETSIGDMVLAQTRAQSPFITTGPRYDAVQAIAKRLVRPGEPIRVYLADTPEVNAFAAPGGVIVLQAGLLRAATDPEQVAGVIAHEIAHVELRHSLRSWVKAAGVRGLALMLVGDWGVLVDAGTKLAQLKFSREAEYAADLHALQRLREAQIDPNGLPRFLAILLKSESAARGPEWLATHPVTAQRISALDRAIGIGGLSTVRPLDIDWARVNGAPTAAAPQASGAESAAPETAPTP